MLLKDEQIDKIADELNKLKIKSFCPVCKGKMLILDRIFKLDELGGKKDSKSPLLCPLVFTMCTKCGYVQLFSATRLGLTSEELGLSSPDEKNGKDQSNKK